MTQGRKTNTMMIAQNGDVVERVLTIDKEYRKTFCLLVVEDDKRLAKLFTDVLLSEGYGCVYVTNTSEETIVLF